MDNVSLRAKVALIFNVVGLFVLIVTTLGVGYIFLEGASLSSPAGGWTALLAMPGMPMFLAPGILAT